MNRIITSNDLFRAHVQAEAQADHRFALREAKKKVKHWERRFKQFGGDVHRETLDRMRAKLVALGAKP